MRQADAVGPRLRKLLHVVFGLLALLGVNSAYLLSITLLEWRTGRTYQNYFYQLMFLFHLVLGLALIGPVVVFGCVHRAHTRHLPNRRAMKVGYVLFATSLLLLASGLVLTRLEGVPLLEAPGLRRVVYWLHVICPLAIVWLFVLHRLAGPRIRWKIGLVWAVVAAGFAIGMTTLHARDPRRWNVAGPASGERYFFPSLSRTATGDFIPASTLMMDAYCRDCHADVHERWAHSAHKFSSFNNPAYLFSVRRTRQALHERDGDVQGSRFCAGCHDPVPFFSGSFDAPRFDDPAYDLSADPLAQAGLTCTSCHAITHVNSPRGNGDYTIEEPIHYPFTFSRNRALRWVNRQLVKAKPAFHKKTFLKPLHRTPEFCGTCHKVHLPPELNDYKWLRGQNHYDAFLLSGVSGHGVSSFYYPERAESDCNRCHMPRLASDDFAARDFDGVGERQIHDHLFPSANTALPHLRGAPAWVHEAHRRFNDGVMRVDVFGLREGGTVAGPLTAPVRPIVPALEPGRTYLVETVIRTVKMGHLFTQGTVDSNQVWLDVTVTSGERVIGRSGGMKPSDGEVDPWSHFVNAFVLDRAGHRIDRRNAEDIFVALYDHQIPPGAAQVVHYRLRVPDDLTEPIEVEVKLKYRKFDTRYMRLFQGDAFTTNDLPIMTLAADRVTFPVTGLPRGVKPQDSLIDVWERWNDYGIGLLLEGNRGSSRGELRQAEAAFARVEALGRPDGPLNRARVYLVEGRLDEAVSALEAAAKFDPPAPPWSVVWFTGLVNKQNGYLNQAIANFTSLLEMDTAQTRARGFDFSRDYRLWNELGRALFERAKQERGEPRRPQREQLLGEAVRAFQRALTLDPENVAAHYNLGLIFAQRGETERSRQHRVLHATYKLDDNARDHGAAEARRRYPAADHAAEDIVICDLQREGAYALPRAASEDAHHE